MKLSNKFLNLLSNQERAEIIHQHKVESGEIIEYCDPELYWQDEEPDMGDVDRGYHIGDFTQKDIEEFKSEYRDTGCPRLKELIDEREDWEKERA